MSYDMEIEQGLNFARAQLARRLNDPEADPSRVADLALATLALVAARDARRRERPPILKMNASSAPRASNACASFDDSAPATINFERAAAALSSRRASDSRAARAAQSAPCLRLYREE